MNISAAITRWIGFLVFWMLLASPDWAGPPIDSAVEMAVGVLAAAAATWVSLHLLPPMRGRLRYGALARLALLLLWQSVVSSVAVLLQALSPRPSIRPGFLIYPTRIAPGPARAAFGALTSMVPGTVPVGKDSDGALVYHCLDLGQPVEDDLAVAERLLIEALPIQKRGQGTKDD
jgi:multicomponent Na+:H+ antiporter subunit E